MKRVRFVIALLMTALINGQMVAAEYREVIPRDHEFKETALYVSALYVISAVGFFLINEEKLHLNASAQYFGELVVFDNDLPTANWGVHVLTGSQTYLFYRAKSYTKTDAFLLTALQSALFEFTIEFVQEPASIEDLINTPLLGSLLGRGFEVLSLPLLNSDVWILRALGHLINLPTLLGLAENQVEFAPILGRSTGLILQVRF